MYFVTMVMLPVYTSWFSYTCFPITSPFFNAIPIFPTTLPVPMALSCMAFYYSYGKQQMNLLIYLVETGCLCYYYVLCSKVDPGLLVRVIPMLSYMMEDLNSSVIKRVMTAFMQLYMMAFMVSNTLLCFIIVMIVHMYRRCYVRMAHMLALHLQSLQTHKLLSYKPFYVAGYNP